MHDKNFGRDNSIIGRFGQSIYRGLPTATLIFCSVALALMGLEVGLRIWDGQPLVPTVNFVDLEVNSLINPRSTMARFDERLGWVHVANRRTAGDNVYTFGEDGIRLSALHKEPVQPGAILVVGDSFGAGSEVDDDDTWPAQLENKVGTRVLNAAVGGYGIDQSVLRAEDLLPRLKPKMLIVQTNLAYGISSNRMSTAGGAPKPYFMVEDGKLRLKNEPVPHGVSANVNIGLWRSVLGYSYVVHYTMTRLNLLQWWVSPAVPTNYVMSKEEADKVSCLLIGRLRELRNSYNIPIALVFQHGALDGLEATLGYWEADRVVITRCAEQEHVPVVDIHQALHAVFQEGGTTAYQQLWVMHDGGRTYGHMSAKGNELVASLVFRQLFAPEVSEAKPQRSER
jgi:hypothetical protein